MCLTEGEIADMMQEGLTGMVEHHRTRMPMPISSDYIAYAWGLCLAPIERSHKVIGLAGAIRRAEDAERLLRGIREALTTTPTDLPEVAMDVAQVAQNISDIADYVGSRYVGSRLEAEKS
jgi:hypothetical protein